MKPTDIKPILEAAKKIEVDDLREALIAHGGSFHFYPGNPDNGHGPCISAWNKTEGAFSACVRSLKINRAGRIALVVRDQKDQIFRIYDENVFVGQLSIITESIPKPAP